MAVEPETCHTTNNTAWRDCNDHGYCKLGGFNVWECQCSKFWLNTTQCATTHFDVVGNVYIVAPLILVVFCSIFLLWMIVEMLADRFQTRRWGFKMPTFYAKLFMIVSCAYLVSCDAWALQPTTPYLPIGFIASNALIMQGIALKTVYAGVALRVLDGIGIFTTTACSCTIITSWLTMISKAKKLDAKSGESKTLRSVRLTTYIILGITGPLYIGITAAQASGLEPRTLNYSLFTVLGASVLYIVVTTSVFLVQLDRWIRTEAGDHKSRILRKTLRKNSFLIAIDIFSILHLFAIFASSFANIAEIPRSYFIVLIVINVFKVALLFLNCMFLENHFTRGGSVIKGLTCSGYIRAFKGLDSASGSTRRSSAATGRGSNKSTSTSTETKSKSSSTDSVPDNKTKEREMDSKARS